MPRLMTYTAWCRTFGADESMLSLPSALKTRRDKRMHTITEILSLTPSLTPNLTHSEHGEQSKLLGLTFRFHLPHVQHKPR